MRRAGRVVAEVLALVEEALRPGVSTAHLDELAEEHIRRAGASAVLQGLLRLSVHASASRSTARWCTAFPADRTIRDGQVVSIDAGAIVDGYHGDAARTFVVGDAPAAVRDLVETTRLALEAGIAAARPGNRIWDVSAAVEDVALARRLRHRPALRRARDRHRHARGAAGPELPDQDAGDRAGAGHLHRHRADVHASARPTSRRSPTAGPSSPADGSLAAHWEDTVAVTEEGPMVLTRL